jgi:hypothetical protein
MFDQTAIALAGTAVRRMQDMNRSEARAARPGRRFVRGERAAAAASAPQPSGRLALQC